MYKVLIPILLTTYYLLHTTAVHAEGFSLAVTPSNIVIQTEAPAHITKQISLANKTDESVDLDIVFQPFTQSDTRSGKVSYLVNKDAFFEKIHLSDNDNEIKSLTLSPRQNKTLTLQIDLPEKEPNKDYYFSILFISKNIKDAKINSKEKIRAYSQIEPAIGTNVLLSIFTGKKEPQGIIDGYNGPLFIQKSPVAFTISFKNTGDYLLRPEATIIIRNMFGQAVGKVLIPKHHVLVNTTRIITANWQEPFLLGPYSAELILTTADDKSVFFRRSIFFFGLPFNVLVGIIAVIIALTLLWKRVSLHLS